MTESYLVDKNGNFIQISGNGLLKVSGIRGTVESIREAAEAGMTWEQAQDTVVPFGVDESYVRMNYPDIWHQFCVNATTLGRLLYG